MRVARSIQKLVKLATLIHAQSNRNAAIQVVPTSNYDVFVSFSDNYYWILSGTNVCGRLV